MPCIYVGPLLPCRMPLVQLNWQMLDFEPQCRGMEGIIRTDWEQVNET